MAMYYQHCYDPQMNRYDSYFSNYNSQWDEYSNTFYGGNQYVEPNYYSQSEYNAFTPQYSDPSIGDLINAMNASNLLLQQMSEQAYSQVILQSTEASLKNLESTMGQIATSLNNLEVENIGESPTKLESNPIDNDVNNSIPEASSPLEIETFTSVGPSSQNMLHKPTVSSYVHITHFPRRLTKIKNEKENKAVLKINISLLKTIKQVPPYAKLPKELSTNKRKLKGDKKISVGENVSVILQRKLLPKCQDLRMFINPYTIGKTKFDHCMIDLGASINVISYSIFASLKPGLLKETCVIIRLADHTNVYSLRVVEDVLVHVQFRRPFRLITSTTLDVKVWVITIEFDGEVIQFDMLNSIDKYKRKKVLLNDPT
ncbi:uncharacterized protein LOC133832842 [Humulus lupulus]|uniref:uncharacterized protein LOC133832842 n=1 Tax=Humulus lupulus TaxID=3486 RepID=UPI002B40BAEC|nr:uncharacterized protein LOC133832842 [Humulus lupulus]